MTHRLLVQQASRRLFAYLSPASSHLRQNVPSGRLLQGEGNDDPCKLSAANWCQRRQHVLVGEGVIMASTHRASFKSAVYRIALATLSPNRTLDRSFGTAAPH